MFPRFYYLREEILRSVVFVCWLTGSFVREIVNIIVSGPNILITVGDRHSVTMEHLLEMAYGESNGYVLDVVT